MQRILILKSWIGYGINNYLKTWCKVKHLIWGFNDSNQLKKLLNS